MGEDDQGWGGGRRLRLKNYYRGKIISASEWFDAWTRNAEMYSAKLEI